MNSKQRGSESRYMIPRLVMTILMIKLMTKNRGQLKIMNLKKDQKEDHSCHQKLLVHLTCKERECNRLKALDKKGKKEQSLKTPEIQDL